MPVLCVSPAALLRRSAADPAPLPRCATPAGSVLLLRELDRQARQEGGAVYMLNGNHESLNVAGDFRWAAAGSAGLDWDAVQGGPQQPAARCR